jgi:ABC-type transporter Mla MlaB component
LLCSAWWSVLKILDTSNGDAVLALSGRLEADNLVDLAAALDAVPGRQSLVLDLKDVVLVDADAVRFLCSCERDGIELRHCPPYIRTWMASERNRS